MNRRKLLHHLALATSGAFAFRAGGAPETAGRIKGVQLAIATICVDGFGNRGHRPAFQEIPALGFRNVEFNLWYPDTITPAYIRGLRSRCERSGLTPVSLQGTSFGGEGRNGIVKDLAHKLTLMSGCEALGCRIVKATGSKRGTAGGLRAVIEVCKELAPVAEEKGILITLENHAGNVLERIEDYEEIFSAIDSPNIGMCLDTGHFEGVGVNLHEVIDRFHTRVLEVDLKDCRARGKGHDTVPFGTGVTDFDAFLKHLISNDYSGYLVVEQAWSTPRADWKRDLASAYRRFQPYERA